MQNVSLLVKPASYQCNLSCPYCFYSRVQEVYPEPKPFMDLETARAMIKKTLEIGSQENVFCWQGGEPTLMGLEFFQEIVGLQRQYATSGQIIGNALQTNGILVNQDWARFLADNRFLVGLSLDGPKDLQDRHRRFASGKGSFDRVMQAAKLFREYGVEFNILTLLTNSNVSQPDQLYGFFREQGFNHLQFIPCYERDSKSGRLLQHSITADQLARFHCRIFDLWLQDGFPHVSIRFLEDILIYFIDRVHVSCGWSETCGSYTVVEHNGDVYPCDFFVFPEWKLGNIVEDTIDRIINNPLLEKFSRMKQQIPSDCRQCKWLSFCNGDCTKFRADGLHGYGNLSAFCSATKMLLDHMEPHMDHIRETALRIREQAQFQQAPQKAGRNSPCPCGSGLKYKKCCGKQM